MFIEAARWPDDAKGTNNDRLTWHSARFPIVADDAPQETKDLVASRGGGPVGDAIKALELQVSVMANPEAGADEPAMLIATPLETNAFTTIQADCSSCFFISLTFSIAIFAVISESAAA